MNTDHNITEVEINGAMIIPFDFTMSTVLKFVQLKKWTYPWTKVLSALLDEGALWTDQIEFFNMAMTVGCTRTKTTTKPSEADLANSFLVVFQAFATAVSATLTSIGGDTDTDGEKKT